jgi:hypothetical protein
MAFKKGEVTNPKGRTKGVPNKATAQAKEAIEKAFALIGGEGSLAEWAEENKSDFYKHIWVKILPLQITGEAGKPLEFKININYPS